MKIILDEDQIQAAVEQVALKLSDLNFDVILCTLSGATPFFSDLIKQLDWGFEVDYIRAKSHSQNTSMDKCIVQGPFCGTNLEDKHILVIEDMIDSGRTIQSINKYLKEFNCKSVIFMALLKRKTATWPEDMNVYFNTEVDEGWLVGYGFDDDTMKRNLPYIYVKW